MLAGLGHGWRLLAFDPASRRGEVGLDGRRLAFDSSAARDEELRVGDAVFVRLQSSDGAPHVARVWPCKARVPAASVMAPPLDPRLASEASEALARIPAPHALLLADEGPGSVLVITCDFFRDAYGIGGSDVSIGEALRCGGARAVDAGRTTAAEVRLADPDERALAHLAAPVDPRSIVVAIPELRSEDAPEPRGRVVLITCGRLTRIAPPPTQRIRAAEAALLALAPALRGLTAVRVDARGLVARLDGRDVPFFSLGPAETDPFVPVCAAWTSALRENDE